jgi:pimeloyl-ACP methyl ester carboxylesterase
MRPFLARFSEPVWSGHLPSWADYITTTPELKFSVHTGVETGMDARLAELAGRYQRKVSLIGWSLGGVFARELARRAPALVRQVITLGSPFANEPKASNAYPGQSGRPVTVGQEMFK